MGSKGNQAKVRAKKSGRSLSVSPDDSRRAIAKRVKALKAMAGSWSGLVRVLGGEHLITRATLGRYATDPESHWGGLPTPNRIFHLAWAEARLRHGDAFETARAVEIAKQWLTDAGYPRESDSQLADRLNHWAEMAKASPPGGGTNGPEGQAAGITRRLPWKDLLPGIVSRCDPEADTSVLQDAKISERDLKVIAACVLSQPNKAGFCPPDGTHGVYIVPLKWGSGNDDPVLDVQERLTDANNQEIWAELLKHNKNNRLSVVIPAFSTSSDRDGIRTKYEGTGKVEIHKIEAVLRKRIGGSDVDVENKLRVFSNWCDNKQEVPTPYYLEIRDGKVKAGWRGWQMLENESIRSALGAHPCRWRWSTYCQEMKDDEINVLIAFLKSDHRFRFSEEGVLKWPARKEEHD